MVKTPRFGKESNLNYVTAWSVAANARLSCSVGICHRL